MHCGFIVYSLTGPYACTYAGVIEGRGFKRDRDFMSSIRNGCIKPVRAFTATARLPPGANFTLISTNWCSINAYSIAQFQISGLQNFHFRKDFYQ